MPPVSSQLSPFLLAIALPIVVLLVLYARPYWLLIAGLISVALPQRDWIIASTRFDPRDLVLFGLVAAVFLKSQRLPLRRVPYIGLWVLLGVLTCIAYVHAPINKPNLTDPIRIAYQLYRYCWKPIAFYPLAYLLIGNDPKARADMITGVVVSGVLVSIHASIQGYSLADPRAFFSGGNSMGGALLIPFVFALAGALAGGTSRRVMLNVAAMLIIARGIIFANSRGAFVATVAGVGAFMCLLMTWQLGRKKVARIVLTGMLSIVALFVVQPNILERPNVKHILTAIQGTSDANFQWRAQQRWPVFMEKIKAHPWFGVGTNRDLTLSEAANTPHNGYLSLAVTYGLPAGFLMVLFVVIGVTNGYRAARRASTSSERIFLFAISGSLAGVLVHNIVESTLMVTFIYDAAWVLTGVTTAMALQSRRAQVGAPARTRVGIRGRAPRRSRRKPHRPMRPVLTRESSQ